MVLVQEGLPRTPGSIAPSATSGWSTLCGDQSPKPIAFVTPTSHGQTDYSAIRAEAPRVVPAGGLQGVAHHCRRGTARGTRTFSTGGASEPPLLVAGQRALVERLRANAGRRRSRSTGGIEGGAARLQPRHAAGGLVTSAAEALAAADRIGYPVVLKAVAATLLHKSEGAGAVGRSRHARAIGGGDDRMSRNLRTHGLADMLTCRRIRGGLNRPRSPPRPRK
jgi:hypothetical protein